MKNVKRIFYSDEIYLHRPWVDEGPKLKRGDTLTIFGSPWRVQFANLALPSDDNQKLWIYPAGIFFGEPEEYERESKAALAFVQRLRKGAAEMSKEDFRAVLLRSIGAREDYADGCLSDFRDNPFGYMLSRRPEAQALALMDALLGLPYVEPAEPAADPAPLAVGTTEGVAAVPVSFALPGRVNDTLRISATAFEGSKPTKWAVRDAGCCLNKSGEMEYEPQPSSRDAEFFARTRWEAFSDALAAATKFVKT